jgi:hypothetical protein
MNEQEARDILKWALQRFDFYRVGRLADAVEALGPGAVAALRALAEGKRRRARGIPDEPPARPTPE